MTDAEKNFDVIVIGSGPGGYVAAIRAAQLGLSAACVEYEELGGVCLNVGCIPTKALLSSALLVGQLKKAKQHGIMLGEMGVDLGPAQKRSRNVASRLVRGIGHLFKKNGVTHIKGYGRLAGGGTVEVRGEDGESQRYHGRNVIIATGSRPRDIPVLVIDGERIWSSTHALFQSDAPGTWSSWARAPWASSSRTSTPPTARRSRWSRCSTAFFPWRMKRSRRRWPGATSGGG